MLLSVKDEEHMTSCNHHSLALIVLQFYILLDSPSVMSVLCLYLVGKEKEEREEGERMSQGGR